MQAASFHSHLDTSSDVGARLADVARVAIVTGGVVPFPVKDPQHLCTVLISFSVVWFVDVPVGEPDSFTLGDPLPGGGRTGTGACQTDPKVAVSCLCVQMGAEQQDDS